MALSEKKRRLFSSVYYNPYTGYIRDPNTLASKVNNVEKLKGKDRVDAAEAREFLDSQVNIQRFKPIPKKMVVMNSIPFSYPNDLWEADLMDFAKIKDENDGYPYALMVIDNFTKMAWAVPLKSKKEHDILDGFKRVLREAGTKPDRLLTDEEAGIRGKLFQSFLESKDISWKNSPGLKAPTAERFIRTIKDKLEPFFVAEKRKRWINVLPKFLSNYRNTEHSSISMTPQQAWKYRNNDEVVFSLGRNHQNRRLDNHQKVEERISKSGHARLNIGDYVRLLDKKNIFQKGTKPRWTEKIYQISSRTANDNYKLDGVRQVKKRDQLLFVASTNKARGFVDVGPRRSGRQLRARDVMDL